MKERQAAVVIDVGSEGTVLFCRGVGQQRKCLAVLAVVFKLDCRRDIGLRRGPPAALLRRHPELRKILRDAWMIRRAQQDWRGLLGVRDCQQRDDEDKRHAFHAICPSATARAAFIAVKASSACDANRTRISTVARASSTQTAPISEPARTSGTDFICDGS